MSRHASYLLFTGLALLTLSACASSYPRTYSAEAIEATVIDAETKQPLEGVVVVAHWQLMGGFEGNNPFAQLQVLEAVTDANGRLSFPAWGPLKRTQGYVRSDDPILLLFKSGYDYRFLTNSTEGHLNRDSDSLRRSEWNGKRIEMKRFGGTETEYAEHVHRFDGMFDRMRDGQSCEWMKIPQMLVALHRMSKHFDSKGIKVTGWQIGARIHEATDVGNQKQCGNADEFFRGYLP